ncbi:MAG: hypothetical protein WCY11_05885 [Novosphingobium sp.]
MTADRKRLLRLQRLEKVRAIARQAAAAEAARAESTLSRLEALADRTRLLAEGYGRRTEAADGHALQQLNRFAGGLQGIAASTRSDADRARSHADARMADLGMAERRRAAVEERAQHHARAMGKAAEHPILGSRRGIGTTLD